MRKAILILAAAMVLCAPVCPAWSAASYVTENWDGYTSGSTPYGPNNGYNWELKNGEWMSLTGGQARSGSQSYSIGDSQVSKISYAVDFAGVFQGNQPLDHIVVQGWFYDSGANGTSFLGIQNPDTVNNALVRIGTNAEMNYVVQYGEFIAGSGVQTVDTGLSAGIGWHFARMDIINTFYLGFWRCQWMVFAEDSSELKQGTFSWFFDRGNATRVMLGAEDWTATGVDWDDIKVGSYDYVGPAPVPEPGSLLVLALGAVGTLGYFRRRRT